MSTKGSKKLKAGLKTGSTHTLKLPPLEITFRDLSELSAEGAPIVKKWLYLFELDTKALYAEIFAESAELWHVEYRSDLSKPLAQFDKKKKAVVVVNRKRLNNAEYCSFLSPVRLSKNALDLLKKNLSGLQLVTAVEQTAEGVLFDNVADYFHYTEYRHKVGYLPELDNWQAFVSDPDLQAKLFIAGTVKNFLADGDPADIGDYLNDRKEPEKILEDYKNQEQHLRRSAEDEMVNLATLLDSVEHEAIDLSAQEGDAEALAVGLLHWGIVSQSMLCVAPGRVFANKLMKDNKALPVKMLLSDAQNPDLPGVYAVFKKAYAAAVTTFTELLAAKVKQLRASAGSSRAIQEKVLLYLRNLSVDAELKGTYKVIHERLSAGQSITKNVKRGRRNRVVRSMKKLKKKAGSQIPDFSEKATVELKTAERLGHKQLSVEEIGKSLQFVFDLISLISAIEDYRNAFPDSKDEKLLAIVGSGGDFYAATAELAESYVTRGRLLRLTGGAAAFISGVVDMLDAEEKAIKSVMNSDDYAAAAGHGITAVGASMTAFAGAIIFAKAVSGGAMFGGPFGAIVGAIGAGLMVVGMLIVSFFSDNDYQSFVRHCFLGEDHSTRVLPDWSTVSFGDGNLQSEVLALFDLLYRYKVSLVKTVRTTQAVPRIIYDF